MLAESKQAIGIATNNVAEYRGLIAGLEEAVKVGATDVDVRMDSKLVVEQMSGRWKVKHPDLRVLIEQATAVAKRFDSVDYAWIPRAENCTRRPAGQRGDGRRGRTGEAGIGRVGEGRDLVAGLDRCPRRTDPVSAVAARADSNCPRSGGIPAAAIRH